MDADPQALDLAAIPDFELGPLRVSPSTCRVSDGDTEERVEARVMAVLVTLARATPRTVTRDELAAACWGGRIVTDDAISRAIAKLRALTRHRRPPAFVVETVTKIGFRLVPAGADAVLERPQTPPRPTSWRPLALVAAGLTGIAMIMAVALSTPTQRQTYVALSPLERRAPELERLSGLTHDAVLRMATASGLAMFEPETNRAHDAEFLLSGVLDRDGDSPTVTLRLTHAETNLALWSHTFVGDEDSEPALADIAATRGIGALRCAVAERARERRRSIAPETLVLYMNVCDASVIGDFDGMIGSARRLVEVAPNSATAHALLSNALSSAASMTRTPAEVAALRREATEEAERALRLDQRQPRAYLALANSLDAPDGWAERERLLQRALALDPNLNSAHVLQVKFLREVGRWREALEVSERQNTGERTSALSQLALLQGSQGDVEGYARRSRSRDTNSEP